RDAMPEGGTLSIEARNVDFSEREARRNIDAEPGPYVCIEVQDTGTGMPDDVADKIFEPFFSTKEEGEGTGLGLSTAYSIVQSHDGFLDVESEEGEGTTFWMYLPVAEDADTTEAPSTSNGQDRAERPPSGGSGERVLVVDDEEFVLESAEQALTSTELIRTLREQHPNLPIVAASGVADGRTDEALDAGAQTFLAKPFGEEKLRGALKEALRSTDESAGR
ncbi:MAG: hybrid sensor histidine kinase/response regulator, partial [Bacteroidetes bacterium QH_2_64_74]